MTVRRPLRAIGALLFASGLLLPSAGCFGKRKATAAAAGPGREFYQRALAELEKRHLPKAKSLLEAVQFTAENRAELEPLVRVSLADVMFYTGDDLSLIEARSKYIEFVTLYGDHPRAPYAQFQSGMCSLLQIAKPARDQSQTRLSIDDFRDVERRWPDSPYARAAEGMIRIAEMSLAEHEFTIGRYYVRRKAYLAASERFRGILESYPSFPSKDKVYLELGRSLILAKNRAEGSVYLDKLISDDPKGPYVAEAKRWLEVAAEPRRKTGKS